MNGDGLIDGRTCDAFVVTDCDTDPSDMAKRAAKALVGSESPGRNSNPVTLGTSDSPPIALRGDSVALRACSGSEASQ